MTLFFLQESKEKNKYKLKINSILNKIEEETDENKIFLSLPINTDNKIKDKKITKLVQQLEKYKMRTVILSENLYNIETLKNELYSRNVNILDGKYLFKLLTEEVVDYICKKSKMATEKTEISIFTNEPDNMNKEIIMNLAEKVKTLNIITNHINKFKELEDYLYSEKGIIVKVSSNYKTALQKTDIILNIDFPEEDINKYFIPSKCIVININGEIKIRSKKFNGININNYNIVIPRGYKIDGYNNKLIYESFLFNKDYKKARKQILKDKIYIKNLIGEKGKINNREFSFFP